LTATFVALLRGVNVGRANRVAMADLRALLADLGYGDVRTLLNSGNAVFTAAAPVDDPAAVAQLIEESLAVRLGVRTMVIMVRSRDLTEAIADNPLGDIADDSARLLVAFPSRPADLEGLAPLANIDWAPEALAVGSRAAYLWCPGGVAESRLWREVSRALGDRLTARNWTTVLKLQALVGSGSTPA
jgi:uncharacterized protein (DUF1697 family)